MVEDIEKGEDGRNRSEEEKVWKRRRDESGRRTEEYSINSIIIVI
jgi:hypothetical protein